MSVKVYASNGKPVGEVRGKTFYKTFKGSRHMLQRPRAIANDVQVLEDAERAGAVEVQERDIETGAVYCATVQCIRAHGFLIDRGFGKQIALALNRWNVNGGRLGGPGGPEVRQMAFDLGPAGHVQL